MGWEASFPAGFDERTTGFPKGIKSTCTRQGGEVQCRHPEGAPTLPASKAVKMGALSVSCALSSLGPFLYPGRRANYGLKQMLRLGGLHQFIEEIRMSEAHQCVDALGR